VCQRSSEADSTTNDISNERRCFSSDRRLCSQRTEHAASGYGSAQQDVYNGQDGKEGLPTDQSDLQISQGYTLNKNTEQKSHGIEATSSDTKKEVTVSPRNPLSEHVLSDKSPDQSSRGRFRGQVGNVDKEPTLSEKHELSSGATPPARRVKPISNGCCGRESHSELLRASTDTHQASHSVDSLVPSERTPSDGFFFCSV